jgi:glycosyltransferase involved in cell wall biosynthesis
MISIFFSTREESNEYKEVLQKTCTLPDVEIIQFVNKNTHSLSEAYNTALEQSKYPILVCVHDDIHLEKGWDKIIYDHFNSSDFGILGMAGTTEIDETGMWWRKRHLMVGEVAHRDKQGKWTEMSYSYKAPGKIHQVACIDGLFMAIHKERIKSNFDEEFKGFHFYDIPFCLRNSIEGVKIGVIFDFKIKHESIGMVSEDWNKSRELFTLKYKDNLPLEINQFPFVSNKDVNIKNEPSLAIIIHSKDNFERLKECIESLKKTNYSNYQIYIADTGSNEENIASIEEYVYYDKKLNLLYYDYSHYASVNNDIVFNYIDKGTELVLFCDSGIEMINDAISIMVSECLKNKKEIGTVGCRLHFKDNKIQHGGIVCYMNKENRMGFTNQGIRTVFGASFKKEENIFGNTKNFFMIRKALFIGIGGFDTSPEESYEDILLSIECILRNYKNIYVGEAACFTNEISDKKDVEKLRNEQKVAINLIAPKFSKYQKKLKNFIVQLG